jgi:hypothetical protein
MVGYGETGSGRLASAPFRGGRLSREVLRAGSVPGQDGAAQPFSGGTVKLMEPVEAS